MLPWPLMRFLGALALVMTSLLGTAHAATPAEFKRAKNLFEYGDFQACIPLFEELVLPGRLEDEAEDAAAHRMLGVAYYQVGRKQEASREFKSLLYINPDAALDPFLTPPEVVEFFDGVKADMSDRLPELRQLRAREKAEKERNKQPVQQRDDRLSKNKLTVQRVRTTPVALFFAPLGIPQFMMGHWGRGAAVVALQLASVLPNIAFFWAQQLFVGNCVAPLTVGLTGGNLAAWQKMGECKPFGGGAGVPGSDTRAKQILLALGVLQVASLVLIPMAYAVGVVDAFILPDMDVVESEVTRDVTPLETRPATPPVTPRRSRVAPPGVSPADASPPRLQPAPAPESPPAP